MSNNPNNEMISSEDERVKPWSMSSSDYNDCKFCGSSDAETEKFNKMILNFLRIP